MSARSLTVLCLAGLLAACKPAAAPVAPEPAAAPAEPATPAPVEAAVTSINFQCGDERISAGFDNAAGNVTLSIGGQPLVLPQAVAASGARYADDKGNEFWNKGTNATLTRSGQPAVECTQTELGSPWDQAKARGAGFRAVGSEPGWAVEVGMGETPALTATLDNGTRNIEIAQTQAITGENGGFSGQTADGTTVQLLIKREACTDAMSGEAFAASAQLKVGDTTYSGCGRFLAE
jgi:membrane-bound inhibitor of C-type lysozyme